MKNKYGMISLICRLWKALQTSEYKKRNRLIYGEQASGSQEGAGKGRSNTGAGSGSYKLQCTIGYKEALYNTGDAANVL